jgi:hypothetical protein
MKRNAILRGVSVLLLVFAMTVIGCKDEKNEPEPQIFPAAKGNGLYPSQYTKLSNFS